MSIYLRDPRPPKVVGVCQVCHRPIYPWEPHVLTFHLSCLRPAGETRTRLKFRTPSGGMIVVPKNYRFREVIRIE